MRFRRSSGGVVEFNDEAFQIMQSHRQISPKAAESGGMLLGRLIDNNRDVVIDRVTVPINEDKKWRFFFFRQKEPAQRIIEQVWSDSKAVTNYLGEWHTHPEDVPSPSSVDLAEWARISQKATFEQDFLLFVIVGRERTLAWEVSRSNLAISMLNLIE
jgi:integrative and conjugative element protein (TIGR02256 family)